MGFITKGQGITVHNKKCSNVKQNEERMIEVSWNMESDSTYLADLIIETDHSKNYLTDIIAIFTKRNIYVDAFKTKEYENSYIYEITLKVKEKEEIEKIIFDLEMNQYVINVRRNK